MLFVHVGRIYILDHNLFIQEVDLFGSTSDQFSCSIDTTKQGAVVCAGEEGLRRGSEIDDDLIDDIECCNAIPIKEQLQLENLRNDSQEEEHDLLKESDSWDDLHGKWG